MAGLKLAAEWAGHWYFLGGVAAVIVSLLLFRRTRDLACDLSVPAGLLLFRNVALFIPMPGTLSTVDTAAFWSSDSYGFVLVALGLYAVVMMGAWIAYRRTTVKAFIISICAVVAAQYVLVAVFLPFEGWSRLTMAFVTPLAVAKVIFIHPVVHYLACLALVAQAPALLLPRCRLLGREVNKLLLILCVVGALPQTGPRLTRSVELSEEQIERTSPWTTIPRGSEFFSNWHTNLKLISFCGVNPGRDRCLVDSSADLNPPESLRSGLRESLPFALACLVLAFVFELLWPRERAYGPAAPAPDVAAVGPWAMSNPPAETHFLKVAQLLVVALVAAAVLAFLPVHDRFLVEPLIAFLGLVWLVACAGLFFRVFFTRSPISCLLDRDQKGRRLPDRVTCHVLLDQASEQHFRELPAERLFALALIGERPAAIARSLVGSRASRGDRATLLTRVDWVCSGDNVLQMAAASSLPREIWSRTANRLISSAYPAARVVGLRSVTTRRRTISRFCRLDPAEEVRAAAWECLQPPRASEARKLAGSKFPDARVTAAASSLLKVGQLMPLADDPDLSVRDAAWRSLLPLIVSHDALTLSRSKQADVRRRAIDTGKLDRDRLFYLASVDQDPQVRAAALRLLMPPTVEEANKLMRSANSDTRLWAAVSGMLSPKGLWLLSEDENFAVRNAAFSRLTPTAADADRMAMSLRPDVRQRAARTGLLARGILDSLGRADTDIEVRRTALAVLWQNVSAAEAGRLLQSADRVGRPAAAQIPSVPRADRIRLCAADLQRAVRQAAWETLKDDLTAEEAAQIALSDFTDSRRRALESRLLPRFVLIELAYSEIGHPSLRQHPMDQLGTINDVEAVRLSESPFADTRLFALRSGALPVSRLRDMAEDPVIVVRAEARRILEDIGG